MFIEDYLKKLKRGPQVILPKDAAILIHYCGMDKNTILLEAGTGSGWFAIQASKTVKKVFSYDKNPEFLELAKKNIKKLGIENIELKLKDVIGEGFDEKNADVVFLDMANSHLAVANAIAALKEDGILAGYFPHIEQLKEFVNECKKYGWQDIYAVEIITRKILIREVGIRPENTGLLHTGYLVFVKKGEEKLTKLEKKRKQKYIKKMQRVGFEPTKALGHQMS